MFRNLRRSIARFIEPKETNVKENCAVNRPTPYPNESLPSSRNIRTRGISFTVYPAAGGTVIETNRFEAKSECLQPALYVVPDTDDISTTLSHIITMEKLRV